MRALDYWIGQILKHNVRFIIKMKSSAASQMPCSLNGTVIYFASSKSLKYPHTASSNFARSSSFSAKESETHSIGTDLFDAIVIRVRELFQDCFLVGGFSERTAFFCKAPAESFSRIVLIIEHLLGSLRCVLPYHCVIDGDGCGNLNYILSGTDE